MSLSKQHSESSHKTKEITDLEIKHYNATVVMKTEITEDLIILRVLPNTGVTPFFPGQYVALGLVTTAAEESTPKLIKRAYSIGSSPSETEFLEFYIAIVKDGALTPALKNLTVGDPLFCSPKITGHFTLQAIPDEANLLLISTGTGIAPFISMITTASTWTPKRKITVLHGVRYIQDLGYRKEIGELQKAQPNLSYFPVVSRQNSEATHRGYVQDIIKSNTISVNPASAHILLCGNPAMINDVQALLLNDGFTLHSKKIPGNLHYEKYW